MESIAAAATWNSFAPIIESMILYLFLYNEPWMHASNENEWKKVLLPLECLVAIRSILIVFSLKWNFLVDFKVDFIDTRSGFTS